MNNFSCTIWQFIAFGFTCLCGGINLGITIGKDSRQKEIEELRDRLLLEEIEIDGLNDRLNKDGNNNDELR